MINIHLIRSNEYNLSRYWEVVNVLQAFEGPLSFISHEKEIDIDPEFLDEEVVGDKGFYETIPMANYSMADEMIDTDLDVSYKPKKLFTNPFKEKDVLKWKSIFKECNDFRKHNNIAKEDFVILLTERRNELNWFTGGTEKANNLFVHTGYWDYFIDCEHQFPVAYECASSVLRKMMFGSKKELTHGLHEKPIGCMNDFCQEKEQIILKLRTADICLKCVEIINKKGVERTITNQVLEIINGVRKQMLFSNGFSSSSELSKLNITGTYCPKILLPDYGNIEIKLTPLEKTLFLLYLNHPEGIAYHDLVDCKTEIREIYSKLANTGDQAEIEERIEALINPLEGSAKEKISKIKQKFTNKLGAELAANYIIQGPRGDKKEITLDREFVVYQ